MRLRKAYRGEAYTAVIVGESGDYLTTPRRYFKKLSVLQFFGASFAFEIIIANPNVAIKGRQKISHNSSMI